MALVSLLMSVYLFTYSAWIESGDSLRLFDTATSLLRYGDTERDESLWNLPPEIVEPDDPFALPAGDIEEPLAIWLSAALVWVSDQLPGLGAVHTAWLLNVIVTALCGGVLYLYAKALGASDRAALAVALAFGLGTMAWTYSKTLFREPLAMFGLLLTGLCIETGRNQRRALWYLLALLPLLAAILTKTTALMALPGLFVLTLPGESPTGLRWRRASDILLVLALLVVTLLAFVPEIIASLPLPGRLGASAPYAGTALHTYLFSIGGSLWGTSPVLLLALPGAWLLLRQNRRRLVWGVLLIVLGYAGGHALLSGVHWFGGLSWPPRFLVPTIPFIAALSFTVWGQLPRRVSIWWLLLIPLLLYSLWVSFNLIAQPPLAYGGVLPPEANGLSEWSPGLNSVAYLRWVLLPALWSSVGFDFAWIRAELPAWALVQAGSALLSGLLLLVGLRRSISRIAFLLLLTVMGISYVGLRGLYTSDGRYFAGHEALAAAVAQAEAEAQQGDVLLLADNTYADYIMNAKQSLWPRPLILPVQPGERASGRDEARVQSESLYHRLTEKTPIIIDQLAANRQRIWLLAHNSVFLPWSVRPVEEYLTERYYLLRDIGSPDPTVRLLEFSTLPAPQLIQFQLPEIRTDISFGDHITLEGVTLAAGNRYQPGDVLALSLYWTTDAPLSEDVIVAWFLSHESGQVPPIQAYGDSAPVNGFMPTTQWQPGVPLWDHRALRLPPDTLPGEYDLWLLLYTREADGPRRLDVKGGSVMEDNIAVIPVRITVAPPS